MTVIELRASPKPRNVPRVAPRFAGDKSPPIIQGGRNQSISAASVFGVVGEGAGLLGHVAGFGVALLLSPLFQPKPIRPPGASVQRRTNVIPFPRSKHLPGAGRTRIEPKPNQTSTGIDHDRHQ
jgi:hypothetical protein